ncbi:MAG: sigma-70 family RNA polymerase sigma factor, partial [Planctomycetes bacterium]|nr:sigma-70 family RNA polymerase sigma factor [Planctomycetota bacterium]
AQDVVLAAYTALPMLKAPENFSSWLFGIAYNRCHKWFQRERTKVIKFAEIRQRALREERLQRRQALHSPPTATGESNPALGDLLRRLPEEIREVLKLKYLEGLSYQEIETRLGINTNRIDYLIRKGKQLLRVRAAREEQA